MSIKFPISPLQAARIDQQATVYKYSLKGATDPAPEGGGVIIEAATNKTINGLQVPALTDEQLLAIYNATVAGKAVTITDATGMMHFSGVTADMVSDEVFVSFVYFDVMVLEYGEGDVTTFKAIGGGLKYKYMHRVTSSYYRSEYKSRSESQFVVLNNSPLPYSKANMKLSDAAVVCVTGFKASVNSTASGDDIYISFSSDSVSYTDSTGTKLWVLGSSGGFKITLDPSSGTISAVTSHSEVYKLDPSSQYATVRDTVTEL